MDRFVVITPGRTGSEFLITMLGSHPDLAVTGELFNTTENPYKGYAAAGMSPTDMLRTIYEISPEKTRGFKMLYYHARDYCGPEFADGAVWRSLMGQEDIGVIHLVRENGLARLISWKACMATGVWHHYTERDDHPVTVTLGLEECRRVWEGIERMEREVDEWFSKHPMMKLRYLDLAHDPQGASSSVLDFLGAERLPLRSMLRKRRPRPFELLENFEELKWNFRDTRWAWFFTDESEMGWR